MKRGSDMLGAIASVDGGLWGYPGFDEDSLGAMSLFTPLGPWPECLSRTLAPVMHRMWLTMHSQHPTHTNKRC